MSESELTTKQQVASIWSMGGLTASQLSKRLWAELNHDDIFGKASEIAYNLLFSLFPLLLLLLALLGIFATHGSVIRNQLMDSLVSVLPGTASQLVSKTLTEITQASGGAKITLGVILGLWTASSGISSMMSGLNMAYDIRDSRPWYKTRGIAIGLTVAIAILTLLAMSIVFFGGTIAKWSGDQLGLGSATVMAWRVIQWPVAVFFMTLAFALIYYYGPDVKEQHWYWITPGSMIGVGLWLAISFGFRVYLHFFDSYSKTYGSLGAVIILLMWFYVTSLGFLVGGEINSEIEHAAAEHGHPEAKAPGEKVPENKAA